MKKSQVKESRKGRGHIYIPFGKGTHLLMLNIRVFITEGYLIG